MKSCGHSQLNDQKQHDGNSEHGTETATCSETDLLGHGFDPPVLRLGRRGVRRRRHLHLAGVSGKAVGTAVKARQEVLQRNQRGGGVNAGNKELSESLTFLMSLQEMKVRPCRWVHFCAQHFSTVL